MAEISRPWGGNLLGDAGRYTDEQWGERYRTALCDSDCWPDRGPLAGSFDELIVEQTLVPSMAVLVGTGSALVDKRWYTSTVAETLVIAANATGVDRYDRIVLRTLWGTGTIRLVVLQGTPGGGIPALTQASGTQYEISLASVLVTSGAVSILNVDITDEREDVAFRRYNFGFSSFVTDPVWNTASIFGVADYGLVWELGINEVIEGSWTVPEEWGDSPLRVGLHLWCYTTPTISLNVYGNAYAHTDAAINLPLWGTVTCTTALVQKVELFETVQLAVTPGELLMINVENPVATICYVLGACLMFRRQ